MGDVGRFKVKGVLVEGECMYVCVDGSDGELLNVVGCR